MRKNLQGYITASTAILMAFCVGCASMPERGLLPDVKARQLPAVNLGPEIILQEEVKLNDDSRFSSLISKDGHVHLFLTDKKKQTHHIEISGNEVLNREMLGVADGFSLDAIEHPSGTLRVVAGDKMFIRSEGGKWQEIKGNKCQRFIAVGEDLLCAFIAKGEEIGGPKRTDWIAGWFILIPVAFPLPSVHADKLVLAQESEDGWAIRAVFDPETKLSARPGFFAGSDQHGSLHFLYCASGGSKWFILAFGGYSGVAGSGDVSKTELRYVRVQHDQFLERVTGLDDSESGPGKPSRLPSSIQGLPLAKSEQDIFPKRLDRLFTINGASGDPEGLNRASQGMWVQIKITDGQWVPHYDVVTAVDLPDSGARWNEDEPALIKSDRNGNTHVLLVKVRAGFWRSSNEMCYFLKTGNHWTAPLILGDLDRGILGGNIPSHNSLAVDETGKVFAIWENKSHSVVGRWILPQK